MDITITETRGVLAAEVISEKVEIKTVQDAVDMMMNCAYQGASTIIIRKKNLIPDFFDLRTGIAGEILQKFSTYDLKLIIVGDFENVASRSLRDFIYESNKVGRISFVSSMDEAGKILAR